MLNRFRGSAMVRACIPCRAKFHRSAVTLIELLIVMGILTILATVSLTTVKGLLRDQKVTRSAQLVEQYIESARIRALTNRRPVAVFLERVAVLGTGSSFDIPVSGNYTATRLTIGEVFPPYTGDELGVTGELRDHDFNIPSRRADGFADEIQLSLPAVASGFGVNGFVNDGDTIEFDGYDGQFIIESIVDRTANPVVVRFFNPPADYNRLRGNNALEVNFATRPPAIPVSGVVRAGFRVYRRPTKSLVGAITLPRGTCVDLAASGFGPASAGAADDSPPFGLTAPPIMANSASPRAYSRIAVVFSSDGRLSGIYAETSNGSVKTPPVFLSTSQILYLMVGRSEQVLPATDLAPDLSDVGERKFSLIQRSSQQEADPILSNLMDPANVWIVCNPFTGEIKSAPVSQVPDAVLSGAVTDLTNNPNAGIQNVVRASRALARSGMREQL